MRGLENVTDTYFQVNVLLVWVGDKEIGFEEKTIIVLDLVFVFPGFVSVRRNYF